MNDRLHIITPVCRRYNIPHLYDNIFNNGMDVEVIWHVVFDTFQIDFVDEYIEHILKFKNIKVYRPKFTYEELNTDKERVSGVMAGELRNHVVEQIDDGWLYFLDDDNLLHENFNNLIKKIDLSNPKIYLFKQEDNEFGVTINKGQIDMAQVLCHKKFVEQFPTEWPERKLGVPVEDFQFIKDLNEKYHNDIIVIDEEYCYYNKLGVKY